MKIKYFLLGMGAAMVLLPSVFWAAYTIDAKTKNSADSGAAVISDGEIRERAARLGMVSLADMPKDTDGAVFDAQAAGNLASSPDSTPEIADEKIIVGDAGPDMAFEGDIARVNEVNVSGGLSGEADAVGKDIAAGTDGGEEVLSETDENGLAADENEADGMAETGRSAEIDESGESSKIDTKADSSGATPADAGAKVSVAGDAEKYGGDKDLTAEKETATDENADTAENSAQIGGHDAVFSESTPTPSPVPASQAAYAVNLGEAAEIYIADGMTSEEISELLAEAGVISDARAFNAYAAAQNRAASLIGGSYTMKKGISYIQILAELTREEYGADINAR
ncbi:MAG: endolytic transglycosylase MltG [Defluviitaleaceae bacterium]|nr:endolytic transglycosylase MltG [Defluviitaleaceae bacterium]